MTKLVCWISLNKLNISYVDISCDIINLYKRNIAIISLYAILRQVLLNNYLICSYHILRSFSVT